MSIEKKIIKTCSRLVDTKVSFFWDPSQGISLSGFPSKNGPLIGRPDQIPRLINQKPVFL